jgi:hypothetical protein
VLAALRRKFCQVFGGRERSLGKTIESLLIASDDINVATICAASSCSTSKTYIPAT